MPIEPLRQDNKPRVAAGRLRLGRTPQLANFRGFLTNVDITLHSCSARTARRVRAEVVDRASQGRRRPSPAGTNPTSRATNTTPDPHDHRGRQSIQSVAYGELGKPAYWRAIADLNGIDDPLRVAPGHRPADPQPSPTRPELRSAMPVEITSAVSRDGRSRRRGSSRSTAPKLDDDVEGQLDSVDGHRPPPHARHVRARLPRPGARHPGAGPARDRQAGQDLDGALTARRPTSSSTARSPRSRPSTTRSGRGRSSAATTCRIGSTPGRKSKTFQGSTYSDIATEIAGGANLETDDRGDARGPRARHPGQPVGSRLPRCARRARSATTCRVDGDTLLFKKPPACDRGPGAGDVEHEGRTELVWGTNLLEFRARIAAAAQVSEVKVRGWDPKKKEAIIGQADVTASHAELTTKPATLADEFGRTTLFVVDRAGRRRSRPPTPSPSPRRSMAGGAGFEATAVCAAAPPSSRPAPRSASPASTRPSRASGRSAAAATSSGRAPTGRTWSAAAARTGRCSGLVASGLAGSAGEAQPVQRRRRRASSPTTTTPTSCGRVKAEVPWLDDQVESHWATLAMPGAGPDYGLVWIPQVNDEVLVAFEQGDIALPGRPRRAVERQGRGAARRRTCSTPARSSGSGFVSRKGHKLSSSTPTTSPGSRS